MTGDVTYLHDSLVHNYGNRRNVVYDVNEG